MVVEDGAGVGGEDVEGGGFDALADGPFDGTAEDALVVLVHAKDKAAVDHHPQVMQAADGRAVIPVEVLVFLLGAQVGRVERLEADEEAAA